MLSLLQPSLFKYISIIAGGIGAHACCALTHRSLFVLKHFIGLFEAAALLTTLPLDVPLSQLLKKAIGSRETLQDGVSILTIQECCNTDMRQNPKFIYVTQQHVRLIYIEKLFFSPLYLLELPHIYLKWSKLPLFDRVVIFSCTALHQSMSSANPQMLS